MPSNVLVFIEQRNGVVKRSALEALGEGKRLAGKLGGQAVALVVGKDVTGPAAEAGRHGADRVLTVADPRLALYAPDAYARAVAGAVKAADAAAVLLSASAMGKDLGGAAAARLGTSCAADCVGVAVVDGRILFSRPVYAGKARATVAFRKGPAVASLRPNVFVALPAGGAGPAAEAPAVSPVEPLAVAFTDADFRGAVRTVTAAAAGKADLTEAERIVTGGRGLKGPENFAMIEELAGVLGATVGATRAVVDAGWRPHSDQVGQTGKTVSPNLYVAAAVSGAVQHLAGMSSSKVIVAINKDPDAPIFRIATYGVVGDAFDVVPALARELKKVLA